MQLINANIPLIYTPPNFNKKKKTKEKFSKSYSIKYEGQIIALSTEYTYLRCETSIDRYTLPVHNLISCTLSTDQNSPAPVDNHHSYLHNGPKLERTL